VERGPGSPMLLFFQHLNASATILAIAACLAPVLNILQSRRTVCRAVGYRRFVLTAGRRAASSLLHALIAFLPIRWIAPPDRVDAGLSFVYNAMRGASVCGFLPWFTHLVHESRG